jgi:hypothetical protein
MESRHAVDLGVGRRFDRNEASEDEIHAYEAGVEGAEDQVARLEKLVKRLMPEATAETQLRIGIESALRAGDEEGAVDQLAALTTLKAEEAVAPVRDAFSSWTNDAVKRHAVSAGVGALSSFLLSSMVTAVATQKPLTLRQRLANAVSIFFIDG